MSLLLVACGGDGAKPPAHGEPAPAFQATTLSGIPVRVPADYAGRVVALRFWADWCPYCRREMAELGPVHTRLRAQGLEILAVNVAQDADTVRRFITPLGIAYPVLLDPDGAIVRSYGVRALPVTWLLDRRGVVRGKIAGEAPAAVFEARVRALLDEGPSAPRPAPPTPAEEGKPGHAG
ncbi:MAG: TlpA family protein disulfide reductase [Thiobacillaceae bacterium]|nr:TlpA family protein disulfide reductase [Thiobacillaceae bacterium]